MNSFLQGKKVISNAPLSRPTGAGATGILQVPSCRPPRTPGSAAEPPGAQVEVVKEGDKVVRLIVTCVCGERVEVECLYPAGG